MADQPAAIDANSKPSLTAVSSADGITILRLYADPTTHRLLVTTGSSGATATTWTVTGNTRTISDATVAASSLIVFMTATPAAGIWGVVPGSGTFTITSSDSESAGLAFTYKVFS